ncbi:RNA polymerase sigma factor [Myxococcota bacterium]
MTDSLPPMSGSDLEALILRLNLAALRFCSRSNLSNEDAEDAAHQALLEALIDPASGRRWDQDAFSAPDFAHVVLISILRNLRAKRSRRQQATVPKPQPSVPSTPEEQLVASRLVTDLRERVRAQASVAAVLEEFVAGNTSPDGQAQALGLAVQQVYDLRGRLAKALRKLMSEQGEELENV